MYDDILFGFRHTLVGVPPNPGLAARAASRTRLRRGFALPTVAPPCTSAQEIRARSAPVEPRQKRRGFLMGDQQRDGTDHHNLLARFPGTGERTGFMQHLSEVDKLCIGIRCFLD